MAVSLRKPHRTTMVRAIKDLHKKFADFLLKTKPRSLRRAALELDEYFGTVGHYHDAQFILPMMKLLEAYIQDIGKTPWSVNRSKTDLRGLHRAKKNRVHIDPMLKDELRKHLQKRF